MTLWIFVSWLFSSGLALTELFQNHMEWILPVFFNYLHLYDNWWFSWHMLSKTKSLSEKLTWARTFDLLRRSFLLIRMLHSYFLHLNLTITVSFLFKRWHTWISSGFTSWPVKDSALQTLLLRTSLPIDAGTGFTSIDSRRWHWALLTTFLSSWTILSFNKRLQVLVTNSSKERISYHLKILSKRLLRSDSLEDMSATLISSSINSSFQRLSSWLIVWTIFIYGYRWYNIKIKLNWIQFLNLNMTKTETIFTTSMT